MSGKRKIWQRCYPAGAGLGRMSLHGQACVPWRVVNHWPQNANPFFLDRELVNSSHTPFQVALLICVHFIAQAFDCSRNRLSRLKINVEFHLKTGRLSSNMLTHDDDDDAFDGKVSDNLDTTMEKSQMPGSRGTVYLLILTATFGA